MYSKICLAELRTLGHEHLGEYNQFVNFQPKIVMTSVNGGGGVGGVGFGGGENQGHRSETR